MCTRCERCEENTRCYQRIEVFSEEEPGLDGSLWLCPSCETMLLTIAHEIDARTNARRESGLATAC
ncbi:MAG: hypothetical protein NDJ94_10255 [Vicinamibacteria bacterium]|nr:hypothetical protein [Vicinamibacteria bacterium]